MILKMKSGGCETNVAPADQAVATEKGHSFFSRLFRSKSADSKKKALKAAPKSSSVDAAPRRRFIRVVRDSEHVGEEYQNPHVIRRYTKGYWEEHQMRKASSLEDTSRPLPYTVSGHTILKKHSFPESDCLAHKRATFKNEVQVIVFSKLEKTATCKRMTRSMPLMTFDQLCRVADSKHSKEEQSSGEEESPLEVSADDSLVQVEITPKDDDECEVTEEAHDEFPSAASIDGDSAVADEVVDDGQFASLVAADEKDLRTKRLKRKLSSLTDSGSSTDSTTLTREV